MNSVEFIETAQIPENTIIFDEFQKQQIYYSYFQVDEKYYLFFYKYKSIQLDFIYEYVHVIQELDSKQRKIRSFRGFFLYALEIMENGKYYKILKTNLQSFFWRKVKNIIRQNQKAALLEFLFELQSSSGYCYTNMNPLEERIASLKTQITSIQERLTKVENQKLNMLLAADSSSKIAILNLKPGDSTSKSEKGAYLGENNSKARKEIIQSEQQSNTFSEASKTPLKPLSKNQQYSNILKLK